MLLLSGVNMVHKAAGYAKLCGKPIWISQKSFVKVGSDSPGLDSEVATVYTEVEALSRTETVLLY